MSNIIFTNFASALLAAEFSDVDTTLQLESGYGQYFPSPSGSQYFYAVLEDSVGNTEVIKVTARATDVLTVSERGVDGTTALTFPTATTRCEIRLVKSTMDEFAQLNGFAMTGDINMNSNEVQDAQLTGSTVITGGQSVGMAIRGTLDDSSNELSVPASGPATSGGSVILTEASNIVALLGIEGSLVFTGATVMAGLPAGAYFQLLGSTPATDYVRFSHDDTDANFVFGSGTEEVNWTGAPLRMNDSILMDDELLQGPYVSDSSMLMQTVAAATTLAVDYTLGQYVKVTMGANIVTFSITNPPASGRYGAIRLKLVQDGTGGRTLAFPGTYKVAGGTAVTLSTAPGAIDYVDLWTDDGGSTWNYAYDLDWS